jgi:hypothetical protein
MTQLSLHTGIAAVVLLVLFHRALASILILRFFHTGVSCPTIALGEAQRDPKVWQPLAEKSHGNQLRTAPGILQRFDRIFGGKSPHNQGKLTIARHLNGCQINTLHVFRGASTASIHFHNKFNVLHGFSLLLYTRMGRASSSFHSTGPHTLEGDEGSFNHARTSQFTNVRS